MKQKNLLIGLILIMVGGVLLSKQFGLVNLSLPDYLFSWPMILIVVGLIQLTKKSDGWILIAIGCMFLVPKIFPERHVDFWTLWPLIFIAIGLNLLFKKNGRCERILPNSTKETDFDILDDIAIFGGGEKIITSNNFKGGKTTAIFGGSIINLSNAQLAEGRNEIEVFTLFGGNTFLIPEDWNVKIHVAAIFGGFSDKRHISRNVVTESNKELHINGFVMFGGGEIKDYV